MTQPRKVTSDNINASTVSKRKLKRQEPNVPSGKSSGPRASEGPWKIAPVQVSVKSNAAELTRRATLQDDGTEFFWAGASLSATLPRRYRAGGVQSNIAS